MIYGIMISRFINCLSPHHLGAAKRILKYICETLNLRIHYYKVQNLIWLDIHTLIGLYHVMIERVLVVMFII